MNRPNKWISRTSRRPLEKLIPRTVTLGEGPQQTLRPPRENYQVIKEVNIHILKAILKTKTKAIC